MYRVLFLDQSQVFDVSIERGADSLTERGADIATERRTNHPNFDPSLEPSIQDLHEVLPQACSIFYQVLLASQLAEVPSQLVPKSGKMTVMATRLMEEL
jgi:hypothetical protein